mmetsp:Transcript_32278/g.96820  ORF Transcript_32278/g.96820 Transcript_32278/m.96820 type:complete len:103 (-) Transcript_32278:1537-1845(-)
MFVGYVLGPECASIRLLARAVAAPFHRHHCGRVLFFDDAIMTCQNPKVTLSQKLRDGGEYFESLCCTQLRRKANDLSPFESLLEVCDVKIHTRDSLFSRLCL